MRYLVFLLTLIFCQPAYAQGMEMGSFRNIPVLEGGRIKPLDSFARGMLTTLSGKSSQDDLTAEIWLAECLFDPAQAVQRSIFNIRNANIRHRLSLPERKIPLYSYAELAAGLGKTVSDVQILSAKKGSELTPDEKDLLLVHENALLYTQILRTFSLILPLDVALPKKIKITHAPTYLELKKYEQDIHSAAQTLVRAKGEDFDKYTENEKRIALLAYQLKVIGDAAGSNQLMRLIPVTWNIDKQDWRSPWAILNDGQGSPESSKLLSVWEDMTSAWQAQDKEKWLAASKMASTLPLQMTHQKKLQRLLNLEVTYNQLSPFRASSGLYVAALLLAIAYFIFQQKSCLNIGLGFLLAGILVHSAGIAVRVILLERPPVSTLYESLIFVSLICALIGIFVERKLHDGIGLLTGSFAALFLAIMASSFGTEGDTLLMLTAVLNTQFWLATHVLCISFGYGWCVVAALIAHILLAARAFKLMPPEKISSYTQMLVILASVALLFTTTGTILGGIWADQSWGRFWGWDPKENGALLIVLWLVWVIHGKLSGHIKPTALLASLSCLGIIVGAAWIGVNLLGVGLHSYGFAEGVFLGLGVFSLLEIILISGLWYLSERNHAA